MRQTNSIRLAYLNVVSICLAFEGKLGVSTRRIIVTVTSMQIMGLASLFPLRNPAESDPGGLINGAAGSGQARPLSSPELLPRSTSDCVASFACLCLPNWWVINGGKSGKRRYSGVTMEKRASTSISSGPGAESDWGCTAPLFSP